MKQILRCLWIHPAEVKEKVKEEEEEKKKRKKRKGKKRQLHLGIKYAKIPFPIVKFHLLVFLLLLP